MARLLSPLCWNRFAFELELDFIVRSGHLEIGCETFFGWRGIFQSLVDGSAHGRFVASFQECQLSLGRSVSGNADTQIEFAFTQLRLRRDREVAIDDGCHGCW